MTRIPMVDACVSVFMCCLVYDLQISWGRPVADKAFRQGKDCLYVETDALRADHSTHLPTQVEIIWTILSGACTWKKD